MYSLCIPVAFILNLSIRQSIFPREFKKAVVVPVYKGAGDPAEPGNYRPISVTSYVAKLFEKCVLIQLKSYSFFTGALSHHQHGFVPARSTETALLEMLQYIVDGWSERRHVVAVFLDLSKAFDCLDHAVLLSTLTRLGVDEGDIRWFNSYLSDR